MKKRGLLIYVLALALLAAALCGCQQKVTTLETILPRSNIIKASVSFLNEGLGDNIPQVSYETVASECTQLCDLLYAALPVTVEIAENYSPELSASHEIYLTTSGGTMTLYYDDYQNLINAPINRKVDNCSVRVYLSFQVEGIKELLDAWKEALPVVEPVVKQPVTEETVFPPDDSALRAGLDASLLEQETTEIAFEPAAYPAEGADALYYAFGPHEKSELPQSKVLVVAKAEDSLGEQASILSIAQNDAYVIITVGFAAPAEGEEIIPAAALCERAEIDVGKTLVFIDQNRSVLYAQRLNIPGEAPETVDPAAGEPADAPSDAAGGEEGDGEPLQP